MVVDGKKIQKKEMATHSSVLAWRIPGTGEPGGLPSMGSQKKKKKKKRKFRYFISIKWLCRNNDVMNINSFQPQMC